MITASAITPAAQRWLAATTSARLLSGHERACNLINQNDDLLAIVASARGLNPFALVAEAPFKTLSRSDRIEVGEGRLVSGDWTIDATEAALWNPSPDWAAVRKAQLNWAALLPLALELTPEGSFLGLFTDDVSGLLARAQHGASLLIDGLTYHSPLTALDGAHILAGLGPGLTPSGDDFIVGAMLAVWAGLGAVELCAPIAEAAAARTTFLSAAYLRAAARGECMIQWHKFFDALQSGEAGRIRLGIGKLMRVGHTSGADALAGFLAVCRGMGLYSEAAKAGAFGLSASAC